MASNTFVPDTVPVKGHSRRMPAKRKSSFVEGESDLAPSPIEPSESPLASALPTIGGAVGGIRGGVAGATTGGMLGEGLRQLVNQPAVAAGIAGAGPAGAALSGALGGGAETGGAPTDLRSAVDRILTQGALQGGSQVAGNVAIGGAKLAGKGAMMLALKATPEAAQTAIKEGITATRFGVKKLFNKIGALGDRTRAVVAAAGQGKSLRAEPIADAIESQVRSELEKSSTSPNDPAVQAALAKLKDEFLQGGARSRITFTDAHRFAQTASKEAEPNFLRLANGERLELPTDPVRKLWKLHEAQVLKETLEHPSAVGPKYAELNARQSKLISLKNVLAPDVNRQMDLSAHAMAAVRNPVASTLAGAAAGGAIPQGMVPGSRIQHALTGAALANPEVLSLLAIGLHSPALLGLLGQAPRAVAAAYK